MLKTPKLSEDSLRQFNGSEQWYRHALNPHVLFTDGAKHVGDEGGAFWLLDIIAVAQLYEKQVSSQPFQVWVLRVLSDQSGILTVQDGNLKPLWTYRVPFTDFPIPEITLWFANGVIYLPSEH